MEPAAGREEERMPTTTTTPTGQYPKPAPIHYLDLESEADRLIAKLPGHRQQTKSLVREHGVSVLMMAMESGDALREHSADGVVIVRVVRGHAVLAAGGESFDVRPGEMVLMQPGVRHDLSAQEQTVVVLTVTGGDE